MTNEEKIFMAKGLCGNDPEATDAVMLVYLADAEAAILNRRYPFGWAEDSSVPREYEMLQCKLASRYFFRRGGEGEVTHSENGISRTYRSPNDEDLLMEVVQIAKVV